MFSQFEDLFWQVTRNMGAIWSKIFANHFPGSQSHLVFMLERKGPTRMSELADSLQLTAGAVTLASDKLIERGYVNRTRDEKDRRVVYLEITELGHQTIKELRQEGRQAMKTVFGHLPEDELEQLIRIFEIAAANATTLRKDIGR